MISHDIHRDQALTILNVSRETRLALEAYADLLVRWNRTSNLVGHSTLSSLWLRHILDCGQLNAALPGKATSLLDIGSGAGLPGLIIAIMRKNQGTKVHLVESNLKKCAFLHQVTRDLNLNVVIHAHRIETVLPQLVEEVNAVMARALAPLSSLLEMCGPIWAAQKPGFFFKGQDVGSELTDATKYWRISYELIPSLVSPEGCILRIDSAAQL